MKRISIAATAAMLAFTQNFASTPGQSFAVERARLQPQQNSHEMQRRNTLPHAPNPFALTQHADKPLKSPYKAGYPRSAALPGGNTVLCGAMVYSDLWGQTDASGNYSNPVTSGFYNIEARPGGKITQLKLNQDIVKMRAGVKVGNIYYAISTMNYDESAMLSSYYVSSWSRRSSEEIDVVNVPTDLTYDPVTGSVYGFFFNDEHQNYDRFCRYNVYDGEATDIYEVDRTSFAIAANAKGEIYGIMGYTGWLIRLYPDRKSSPNGYGFEYIGKTGFSPGYTNSMAFDDATGKLYWCANSVDGYSALLEVDTATGAATEIMHFADNATFAGIFAQPYKIPDAAPAAPQSLLANFTTQGATTATLSCTAPSKTYNGGTLAGPLSVVFSVNGTVMEQIDNVSPGAQAVTSVITLPEGPVSLECFAASTQYCGESAKADSWCGEDAPGPVTDLRLEDVGSRPTLTWTAPATGQHGQWFNPAGLTYTITRYPDLHTVAGITATTWSDEAPAGMAALWYEVVAVNAKGESEPVATPKTVFGDGFPIPFTERFESQADFDLWKVIDLNGGTTWQYDSKEKCVSYSYGLDVEREGNDWLISPKFELKKGVTYALIFSAKSRQSKYPENFKFCLGKSDDPAAMTQVIADRPNFDNPAGYKDERVMFTVAEDGTYYLGLHCYSIAHNWTLSVDNIGILEVSAQVPAPVSGLTVTPAPQGALKATITLKAPATYTSGDAMTAPVNVTLYRNAETVPCKKWDNTAPGTSLTWEDTSMAAPGMFTYRAMVSNSHGDGETTEASAFIGTDIPGPVENLTISEAADGIVTLTWEAPTRGANGGYFNPDGITYRVMRSVDVQELAKGITETTYTDRTLNLTSQNLCYYLVWPIAADGTQGAYANTPLNVILGPALEAPVSETFAGADMQLYPWTDESDGSVRLWTLENAGINPPCADQNGDRGLAMCISTPSNAGITGSFLSPKISLASLTSPQLAFWFYHSPSPAGTPAVSETLTVRVSTGHGDFADIPGAVFHRDNGTTGWSRYTVDLSPWRDADFIRLSFAGKSAGVASMYIDNITIGNAVADDIEMTSLSGPSRIAAGITTEYEAIVSNLGTTQANGVALTATFAGNTVGETVTVDLAAGTSARVSIPVSAPSAAQGNLTVTATHTSDSNPDNNAASCTLAVVEPVLPAPDGIAAVADGLDVSLSWLEPADNPAVSDDVESYEDYAIAGIGDYTLVDRDWGNTYAIKMDESTTYPYMHDPKAFQVLNTNLLGIDIWPEGEAHSGKKVLGALSSMDMPNDDWLISPRLNGAAQTVEFYAKSMTVDGVAPERMRVLYSTGSTEPEEFVVLHTSEYIELPDAWTCYRYVLPEGARYFAINCVSNDSFVLMVDDLRFNDLTVLPVVPSAYEVYRDGELIATVTDPQAADKLPGYGKYTYRVRALFGSHGYTDSPSYQVDVRESSIGEVAANSPRILTGKGSVTVENAQGLPVSIILPDGRTIYSGTAESESRHYSLCAGVYIVTAGTTRSTVVVR